MDGASDTNWYLDSGETYHLTNDMNNMHIAEPFASIYKLVVGNGTSLSITHLGHATLKMLDCNTKASFILNLNNILLVPQITKNLISISQLTKDNNLVVEFTDKFCFVKDKVKNLIILQGKANKGLYKLLLMSPNKTHSHSRIHVKNVEFVVPVVPLSMFSAVSSDLQDKISCSYTTSAPCMNSRCLLSTTVLH